MTEVLAISIGVALVGGLVGLAFGCIIGRECSPNWDLLRELEKENELLGERCNQLLKDKGKLTDKVKSLEEDKNKRLEQAKEIIEDFMITETGGIGYSKLYDKAGKFLKKFLKEIEK